jgi:hypothetical protein
MIETMNAPLPEFFVGGTRLSASEMQALIDDCRARKQTGVMVMQPAGGKSLTLFLKRGEVVNAFLVSPQTCENVPPEQWNAWIDSAAGAKTRLILLSAQGVLMAKLLIQNTGGKTETFTSPGAIGAAFETQKKTAVISLVRFEWESALGAVIYYGSPESRYSLYLSADTVEEQAGIAPALLAPTSPNCRVTVFDGDQSVDAWQEILLRRAFADICDGLLSRFQALAGRALVDSLIRLTLVFASRRNLNINITARKLVDEEFFSSPHQAADSYRPLLKEMLIHFSGISGSRMLSSVLREIVTSLPARERTIVHDFSFFTEGYNYERNN